MQIHNRLYARKLGYLGETFMAPIPVVPNQTVSSRHPRRNDLTSIYSFIPYMECC